MKLTHDWRVILRHAWSVRLMIVAAILSGLEVALPLVGPWLSIHPGIFAGLSAITVSAAFVARFTAQRTIKPEPEDKDDEHA